MRTYSKNQVLISERRNQIVKAATKLFIRKGFLKTSTREIAHESGLGQGTLYHYIGKKDDILGLFTDAAISRIKHLEEIVYRLKEKSPPERLTTVIRAYLQWVDEHQDMIVFWYQETKNLTREFRRRLFDSEHRLADLFKKLINDGCSGDVFCVKDISLMASNIIIMCDMWAFRRWDLRKAYTLDEYADIQIEGILNSIRKQR